MTRIEIDDTPEARKDYRAVDTVAFGETHWSAAAGDWNSDEGDTDNSFRAVQQMLIWKMQAQILPDGR